MFYREKQSSELIEETKVNEKWKKYLKELLRRQKRNNNIKENVFAKYKMRAFS